MKVLDILILFLKYLTKISNLNCIFVFQVIIEAPNDIALHGIEILKEIYTNLGLQLRPKKVILALFNHLTSGVQ